MRRAEASIFLPRFILSTVLRTHFVPLSLVLRRTGRSFVWRAFIGMKLLTLRLCSLNLARLPTTTAKLLEPLILLRIHTTNLNRFIVKRNMLGTNLLEFFFKSAMKLLWMHINNISIFCFFAELLTENARWRSEFTSGPRTLARQPRVFKWSPPNQIHTYRKKSSRGVSITLFLRNSVIRHLCRLLLPGEKLSQLLLLETLCLATLFNYNLSYNGESKNTKKYHKKLKHLANFSSQDPAIFKHDLSTLKDSQPTGIFDMVYISEMKKKSCFGA